MSTESSSTANPAEKPESKLGSAIRQHQAELANLGIQLEEFLREQKRLGEYDTNSGRILFLGETLATLIRILK